MDIKKIILTVVLSGFIGALAAVATVFMMNKNERKTVVIGSDGAPVQYNYQNVEFDENHFPDFTFAAERCVNSVVHVKVVVNEEQPITFLDFFFGIPNYNRERVVTGAGSGVIISEDGYIVTNNHVINGAQNIEVTLSNNRKQIAHLVGTDPRTDIALLKIEGENLPFLDLGDSDNMRLGEWVLAIGNPYNLRSTITAGIVSAKARSFTDIQSGKLKIESFIQTDAAVNPGNSGGALVNTKGELIGINTAIASSTGSYVGYSFAIPSNMVRRVVEDLKKFGSVKRAVLGVSVVNMTDEIARDFKSSVAEGAGIYDVQKESAAEKAGIRAMDVIVAMNDVKISNSSQVMEMMMKFRPGDTVAVQVVRGDERLTIEVVLQEFQPDGGVLSRGQGEFFGAVLSEVPKEDLLQRGIRGGVKVVNAGNGKFWNAGIRDGLIITHVNNKAVHSISDFSKAVKTAKRSILIEGVDRNGKVMLFGMGLE